MFKNWKKVKQTSPKMESEKIFPYQRILSALEELNEADVVALERFLTNLKTTVKNKNQRTKGASLKQKQKSPKKERTLRDEIEEAQKILLTNQFYDKKGG